jgi:hypothetical protein
LNGITSVPNFMKFYQVVQKLLVGDTHTHRQTDRQTGDLISLLSSFFFFFLLTRIKPQWPVTMSLRRLGGLPRDLLPFGRKDIICRGIRLRSILCSCCFQFFLNWSVCSSTELIFNSRRISVFLFLSNFIYAAVLLKNFISLAVILVLSLLLIVQASLP